MYTYNDANGGLFLGTIHGKKNRDKKTCNVVRVIPVEPRAITGAPLGPQREVLEILK